MREAVRAALRRIAARFSPNEPAVDERILVSRYPAFRHFPADAELALCLLGWVHGAGFRMTGFREAIVNPEILPDFARAARAVSPTNDPTLAAIHAIARACLENAAVVLERDLNHHHDLLYWPTELGRCRDIGTPTEKTP